jgi:hypothetical protein
MFVKIVDGTPVEYSMVMLRKENPNVSFPRQIGDDTLAEYGLERLRVDNSVVIDSATQKQGPYVIENDNGWVKRPSVVALTPEEIAAHAASVAADLDEKKRLDYQKVSDPIFFKWQAGEATEQEWLDARALVDGWYANADNG